MTASIVRTIYAMEHQDVSLPLMIRYVASEAWTPSVRPLSVMGY